MKLENDVMNPEEHKRYFLKQVSDFSQSTLLTPNKNGKKDDGKCNRIDYNIEKKEICEFCNDKSISENALFLASAALLLNKFNFTKKNLIYLENNVPLSTDFEDRQISIGDYLKKIEEKLTECGKHGKYSFDELLEEYNLKTELHYSYNSQSTDATPDHSNQLDITEHDEAITISFTYPEQFYTSDYIELFLRCIEIILKQIIHCDINKTSISDICIRKEKENIELSEIEIPYFHKHFEKQVEKTPDKLALIVSDERLTYDELNQKANRIANALIKRGVKPKNNILVVLSRDSNLIAAILGVLKAGCAFIPMDPEYPKDRIDYIYQNSESKYIISNETGGKNLDIEELIKENDTRTPNVDIDPDDLAYMIYTSGSTGNPKGVMIRHKNISNLIRQDKDDDIYHLYYSKMKKPLGISTISFDAFLIDFMSLTFGLTLVLANDDEIKNIKSLTDLIRREKPDAITSITPSRLQQYLEYDEFRKELSSFKSISLGGEKQQKDLVRDLIENYNITIYNGYGPTEATITCNRKQITDLDKITIGKSLHNYIMDVRDIDGKLLPSGIMGELNIGGPGVGKGYYKMEEKTKEVFIEINGMPYYKSGDYAIEDSNGEIIIKGRIDNQIKLRGLRIEIGEIESTINNYPNIKRNAVLIKKINNAEHLCAYFTAKEKIDKDNLKEYLKSKLTPYMVPTILIQIDKMPQTPNGKTDIKQLPEPKIELNYIAPANKLEQTLCSIFSITLNLEVVGAEDNFFEIGGTSLSASKLIIELIKHDYEVKYEDIFNNQTPRKLAKAISGDLKSDQINLDMIKKYDYTRINELLKENTLENFHENEKRELGNVLLTGATGYLGIHVLYELVKNETGTIYCMLRKGEFDSIEEHLTDLLDYYFDEDFSYLIGSRIILSEGDITQLDDFKKLKDRPINTLINCAANVKHYSSDDTIFRANTDGVINGAKFARSKNIRFIQISTVSVLSPPTDESIETRFDEQTLYYNQDLTNKYINSKFLAEKILLGKCLDGLDAKIIRVGNLMPRYSDGLFQKNYESNAFLSSVRALKNIRAVPAILYGEIMEMSPIDYVAKSIIALSKTPKQCRVFNCLNENMIHTKDLIETLNNFGCDIKKVSDEDFIRIIKENLNENIQGLIISELSISELKKESEWREYGKYINIDQTCEILHSLGFNWPEINQEYLKQFIRYLS